MTISFKTKYSLVLANTVLVIILGIVAVQHLNFARDDSRPCMDHDLEYAGFSVDFYYFGIPWCGQKQGLLSASMPDKINYYLKHTPLITLLDKCSAVGYCFLGKSFLSFRLSLLPLFILVLLSLYLLGNKTAPPYGGLIAVIILLSVPGLLAYSRKCSPHLYVGAFILLSLFFFLESQAFLKRLYALLFGLTLGVGLTIHHSAFIYICIILLWLLFTVFTGKQDLFKVMAMIAASIVCAGVLSFFSPLITAVVLLLGMIRLWYIKNPAAHFVNAVLMILFFNFDNFKAHCLGRLKDSTQGALPLAFSQYFIHDIPRLFTDTFSLWFTAVLLLVCIISLFYKRSLKKIPYRIDILFLLLLLPSVGLIVLNRGIMAHLPSFLIMALLIGMGINYCSSRLIKGTIIAVAVFYVFINTIWLEDIFVREESLNNPYQETLIIDNRAWGRREINHFFKEQSRIETVFVGLLNPDLWYYAVLYPYDKLALELEAGNQPICAIQCDTLEEVRKLVEGKKIEYFLFEKNKQGNTVELLPIEYYLTHNDSLILYRTIDCPTKEIYFFKYVQ